MEQCRRKLSYPDWGSGCYQVSVYVAWFCLLLCCFFFSLNNIKGKESDIECGLGHVDTVQNHLSL